jgi:hypothetical protein
MDTEKKSTGIIFAAIFAISFLVVMPASAHYPGADINCPETTMPPTIDGVISPGEWDDASAIPVEFLFLTDENLTGIFYTKYNSSYLYVALVINDPDDAEPEDGFGLEFDEGHTGTRSDGDSGLAVLGDGTCLMDFWYNETLGDWDIDTTDLCDFSRAVSIDGDDEHVWELAIPFDIVDMQDLDITPTPGKTIGVNLQYYDNNCSGDGNYNGLTDGADDWPDEGVEDDSPYLNPYLWADLTFGSATVPILTPTGLIALVGLLSAIAAVAIVRKRR